MNNHKLLVFIESLATDDNKELIEHIKQGYEVYLEYAISHKLDKPRDVNIATRVEDAIQKVARSISDAKAHTLLLPHSDIVDFISDNIGEFNYKKFQVIERYYESLIGNAKRLLKERYQIDNVYEIHQNAHNVLNILYELVPS